VEDSQARDILGPLVTENMLSDIPLFGPGKADIEALVDKILEGISRKEALVADDATVTAPLDLSGASTIAEKLRALRVYIQENRPESDDESRERRRSSQRSEDEPLSRLERHERLLRDRMSSGRLPIEAQVVLNHIMLLRAKEKYLFNSTTNQRVVAEDPWLRDVWGWVAGAEEAASDGGMMSHPLDLSYMGVYSIWTNNLGLSPPTCFR
jgi:hypothetical protein